MKDISFVRDDNVLVTYPSTLKDINNLVENFTVIKVTLINTYLERKLLYGFDAKQWTLTEMIFFANNNRICIKIYDHNTLELLKSYGVCAEGNCGGPTGLISEMEECLIGEDGEFLIEE